MWSDATTCLVGTTGVDVVGCVAIGSGVGAIVGVVGSAAGAGVVGTGVGAVVGVVGSAVGAGVVGSGVGAVVGVVGSAVGAGVVGSVVTGSVVVGWVGTVVVVEGQNAPRCLVPGCWPVVVAMVAGSGVAMVSVWSAIGVVRSPVVASTGVPSVTSELAS